MAAWPPCGAGSTTGSASPTAIPGRGATGEPRGSTLGAAIRTGASRATATTAAAAVGCDVSCEESVGGGDSRSTRTALGTARDRCSCATGSGSSSGSATRLPGTSSIGVPAAIAVVPGSSASGSPARRHRAETGCLSRHALAATRGTPAPTKADRDRDSSRRSYGYRLSLDFACASTSAATCVRATSSSVTAATTTDDHDVNRSHPIGHGPRSAGCEGPRADEWARAADRGAPSRAGWSGGRGHAGDHLSRDQRKNDGGQGRKKSPRGARG